MGLAGSKDVPKVVKTIARLGELKLVNGL
jgi:hypothetical protein